MPWPPKQEAAIFLSLKRRYGEAEARRRMRRYMRDKKPTYSRRR